MAETDELTPAEARRELADLKKRQKDAEAETRSLDAELKQQEYARGLMLLAGVRDEVLEENQDRIAEIRQRQADLPLLLRAIQERSRVLKKLLAGPSRRSKSSQK